MMGNVFIQRVIMIWDVGPDSLLEAASNRGISEIIGSLPEMEECAEMWGEWHEVCYSLGQPGLDRPKILFQWCNKCVSLCV